MLTTIRHQDGNAKRGTGKRRDGEDKVAFEQQLTVVTAVGLGGVARSARPAINAHALHMHRSKSLPSLEVRSSPPEPLPRRSCAAQPNGLRHLDLTIGRRRMRGSGTKRDLLQAASARDTRVYESEWAGLGGGWENGYDDGGVGPRLMSSLLVHGRKLGLPRIHSAFRFPFHSLTG